MNLDQLFDLNELTKDQFSSSFLETVGPKPDDPLIASIFDLYDTERNGICTGLCLNRLKAEVLGPIRNLTETAAFVVVDFQNDFISGNLSIGNGPAKEDPVASISPINNILKTVGNQFSAIIYTLDWHPPNHISFVENVGQRKLSVQHQNSEVKTFDTVTFEEPKVEQILWPNHCIQETWGSELHSDLFVHPNGVKVRKGTHPEIDSYSAFFDNHKINSTELDAELKKHSVTVVFVCGLAYDVCVGATAHDALELGYKTVIVDDCCKGLDKVNIEKVRKNVTDHGGVIMSSSEVVGFMRGEKISWNFVKNVIET